MKGIVKFFLRTGAGQMILGTLLDLVIKEIRFRIRNRPRDHQDIINTTLTAIEGELREELHKELLKRV